MQLRSERMENKKVYEMEKGGGNKKIEVKSKKISSI